MAKPLCKRRQQLKENIARYAAKVDNPRAICGRCGRAANRKKLLCEPIPLSDFKD